MAKYISSWNQLVEGIPYTPGEFLTATERLIVSRQLPNVSMRRVTHGRGSLGRRQYLRVKHRSTYIDIGAMPYGDGFAVSWVHESDRSGDFYARIFNFFIWLWGLIPEIGRRANPIIKTARDFAQKDKRTLYHIDDEIMFQKMVHDCVVKTLNDITDGRGSRGQRPIY
ncbi:MAG: hypothetical protein R8P61_28355 [Bacteroidia bacterium]|nr:hypothetical protein [Bacteroidia bacterium]